jgi:hypothetical protein
MVAAAIVVSGEERRKAKPVGKLLAAAKLDLDAAPRLLVDPT